MNKLLEGKVAIVTGGAKGLGYGISRALASEGASVLISGRDGAAAETVAAEIERDFGSKAIGIAGDMGVKEDVLAMVQRAVDSFGGLDILVNNASLLSAGVLLEDKTDEMLRRTLEIGVWGNWWAMQAAFPHMKRRGGGSVINFSSIDAQTGAWLHSDYNINKLGIEGLTRSAAVEWGRFNIRVNALAPGYVRTELTGEVLREHPDVVNNVWAKGAVQNRIGSVEELVGATVYLASDAASFTTGEIITIDGGLTLR